MEQLGQPFVRYDSLALTNQSTDRCVVGASAVASVVCRHYRYVFETPPNVRIFNGTRRLVRIIVIVLLDLCISNS